MQKVSTPTNVRVCATLTIAVVVGVVLVWRVVSAENIRGLYRKGGGVVVPTAKVVRERVAPVGVEERIGVPVRIEIPRLAVRAAVEGVKLAADGAMDVPTRPSDTAWYALGPRPGEIGSAVIAGHVRWKNGVIAAFTRLHTLKPGDAIIVYDGRGVGTSFIVRGTRAYDAAADATAVFSSRDGKAHLNLVTCFGAWDKRTRQYVKRLVVFADRVVHE